jgi:hypothetical protein
VEYLRHIDPLVAVISALLCLLAALVLVVNWQGKKLVKHDVLLDLLEVRVGNIHKDREATRVRKLQHPAPRELVPPPLPPRAPTIDATDWGDDDQETEQLHLKTTARYPRGSPPEGTE